MILLEYLDILMIASVGFSIWCSDSKGSTNDVINEEMGSASGQPRPIQLRLALPA